jgi:hypothetical protein
VEPFFVLPSGTGEHPRFSSADGWRLRKHEHLPSLYPSGRTLAPLVDIMPRLLLRKIRLRGTAGQHAMPLCCVQKSRTRCMCNQDWFSLRSSPAYDWLRRHCQCSSRYPTHARHQAYSHRRGPSIMSRFSVHRCPCGVRQDKIRTMLAVVLEVSFVVQDFPL